MPPEQQAASIKLLEDEANDLDITGLPEADNVPDVYTERIKILHKAANLRSDSVDTHMKNLLNPQYTTNNQFLNTADPQTMLLLRERSNLVKHNPQLANMYGYQPLEQIDAALSSRFLNTDMRKESSVKALSDFINDPTVGNDIKQNTLNRLNPDVKSQIYGTIANNKNKFNSDLKVVQENGFNENSLLPLKRMITYKFGNDPEKFKQFAVNAHTVANGTVNLAQQDQFVKDLQLFGITTGGLQEIATQLFNSGLLQTVNEQIGLLNLTEYDRARNKQLPRLPALSEHYYPIPTDKVESFMAYQANPLAAP